MEDKKVQHPIEQFEKSSIHGLSGIEWTNCNRFAFFFHARKQSEPSNFWIYFACGVPKFIYGNLLLTMYHIHKSNYFSIINFWSKVVGIAYLLLYDWHLCSPRWTRSPSQVTWLCSDQLKSKLTFIMWDYRADICMQRPISIQIRWLWELRHHMGQKLSSHCTAEHNSLYIFMSQKQTFFFCQQRAIISSHKPTYLPTVFTSFIIAQNYVIYLHGIMFLNRFLTLFSGTVPTSLA